MCISFIVCATDDKSTCDDIMGSRHQRRKIFPDPLSSRFRHEKGNLILPVRPGTRTAEPEKDKVKVSQPVISCICHDTRARWNHNYPVREWQVSGLPVFLGTQHGKKPDACSRI